MLEGAAIMATRASIAPADPDTGGRQVVRVIDAALGPSRGRTLEAAKDVLQNFGKVWLFTGLILCTRGSRCYATCPSDIVGIIRQAL